jgi:hypothetical protein
MKVKRTAYGTMSESALGMFYANINGTSDVVPFFTYEEALAYISKED